MNKFEFPVTIYGNLEKYNDVTSKARCRIFYKYGNRNGTYITDEFAEKLLSTIAYAPVKGIFEYDDYTDHGTRRSEGRIYGIVPENYNLTWEAHVDEDGVERTYACVDVIIFTALYKEANDIIGKSQSMELYEPSLQYHKQIIEGQQYIVFDAGCFLGLQVLGDEVEPCFEGAAFFSLRENIEQAISKIQELTNTFTKKGGKEEVKVNFKLSDGDKYEQIFDLLNTNFNEEGNWTVTYGIGEIYDDYALVYNLETKEVFRAYYQKGEDTVTLGDMKKVYIIDITEEEKVTVDTLRRLNGETYEKVEPVLENAKENFEKISELEGKKVELENSVSTLNTEKSALEEKFNLSQGENETLKNEIEALKSYKLGIEKEQKESVLSEYENQLSDEILNSYKEKINEYSVIDLDKELAYELKKANISAFTKQPEQKFVQKNGIVKTGLDEILNKYVK
jgi:hypothetical protein